MSRDFLLVLGGGAVSLVTTLVVLFVADWLYRRDQASTRSPSARESRSDNRVTEQQG